MRDLSGIPYSHIYRLECPSVYFPIVFETKVWLKNEAGCQVTGMGWFTPCGLISVVEISVIVAQTEPARLNEGSINIGQIVRYKDVC